MKRALKKLFGQQRFKRTAALFMAVIVISTLMSGLDLDMFNTSSKVSAADNDAPVISTMSIYKDTDYTFLKNFDFGKSNEYESEAVLQFDTAADMKSSNDIRLKSRKYNDLSES